MTAEEVRAAALELVERTTAAHGVPRYVEDERTLRRVAAMLAGRAEAPANRGPDSDLIPTTRTDTGTTPCRVHGNEHRRPAGASRGRR